MSCIYNLPSNQNDKRCKEKTPAEEIPYKQHRGEHHEMSPVIYSAIDAAFILHDICLERAIKYNANVITKKIKNGKHEKVCAFNHMEEI